MTQIQTFLDEVNGGLKFYEVRPSMYALREDGNYQRGKDVPVGYEIVNTETKVVEFTTPLLVTAIYQAEYIDKSLDHLMNHRDEPAEADSEPVADDVILN